MSSYDNEPSAQMLWLRRVTELQAKTTPVEKPAMATAPCGCTCPSCQQMRCREQHEGDWHCGYLVQR